MLLSSYIHVDIVVRGTMYGGSNHGRDDGARMQMNSELERLKEQSRIATQQTLARVNQLREEQQRISELLNEKEVSLLQTKARQLQSSTMDDHSAVSNDQRDVHKSLNGESPGNVSNLDDDVRIQSMIKDRDEKIMEIQEIIHDKEIFLRSLQDDTEEQQETIQELQQILEGLQSASGNGLRKKLLEKEHDLDELEDELEGLQHELTEEEQILLELEEEWHDREDHVADAEADSADNILRLQKKIEMYAIEILNMKARRTELTGGFWDRIEALRQDFMDFLGPNTCRNLMIQIHQSFEEIQRKEQDLASALLRRLDERKSLLAPMSRLEILDKECNRALRKLSSLSGILEAKMRFADDSESGDSAFEQLAAIEDQISSGFDEVTQELVLRLENLEQNVFEAEDGTVEAVERSIEKLNVTIQTKFRQVLSALADSAPDLEEDKAEFERKRSHRILRFDSMLSSLTQKQEELKRLEKELDDDDHKSEETSDDDKKKIALLEEEIEFISSGLREKDSMISTIMNVTKERRDAEAYLVEELQLAYEKGIIRASDFGELDESLLEKARIKRV